MCSENPFPLGNSSMGKHGLSGVWVLFSRACCWVASFLACFLNICKVSLCECQLQELAFYFKSSQTAFLLCCSLPQISYLIQDWKEVFPQSWETPSRRLQKNAQRWTKGAGKTKTDPLKWPSSQYSWEQTWVYTRKSKQHDALIFCFSCTSSIFSSVAAITLSHFCSLRKGYTS